MPDERKADAEMWLNAMIAVHPSDKFLMELGKEVMQLLREATTGQDYPKSATILFRLS